jgi:hypothetical protein
MGVTCFYEIVHNKTCEPKLMFLQIENDDRWA